MSARHTPQGDRSFATSLLRHVAAGAALVAVVALAFWGIGRFRAPSPDGPVISAPTEQGTEPTDGPTAASPTGPTADPTSATEPTSPSPSPTASPTATTGERSAVTVQVLSATGGDGERMQEVVDRLRELGYQVVATGRAVRTYDRSTIFYTEGHRDAALTIQQDIPELGVIEEKPDNLSDAVDTHVIVGLDYPEP